MSVGRIRSIKPELPSDETLGRCSIPARWLVVCSWATCCDNWGRFRAAPALIKGALFPYDSDITTADVEGFLNELDQAGRIELYEIGGQRYGAVVNWSKHQRVDERWKGAQNFPDPPLRATTLRKYRRPPASTGESRISPNGCGCGWEGMWKKHLRNC